MRRLQALTTPPDEQLSVNLLYFTCDCYDPPSPPFLARPPRDPILSPRDPGSPPRDPGSVHVRRERRPRTLRPSLTPSSTWFVNSSSH
eukprot:1344906-Rhodomonas_salina.1